MGRGPRYTASSRLFDRRPRRAPRTRAVMVIGAGVNETFGYYKSGVLPCATDDYHNHAMALVAYT